MDDEKQCTVGEAWRKANRRLTEAGVADGSFEAEVMLRSILGWERTRFFLELNRPLAPEALMKLQTWTEERLRGVPLQHLTGMQEFYGRSFAVGPEVLIPRPDTETLVKAVLQEAEALFGDAPLRVADVGTGSGILAVTLAAERPGWRVTAGDRSQPALAVARRNAKRLGVDSRIAFRQGDWLSPLIRERETVDIIVSNPPYIPTADVDGLDREVRCAEPRLALDGGRDGLDPYRILLGQIPQVLARPGLVAFEIGWDQGERVAGLTRSLPGASEPAILPDLAGRDRVVTVRIG